MKIYKDFIIVKALNRDRDLGLRIIKNKLYTIFVHGLNRLHLQVLTLHP